MKLHDVMYSEQKELFTRMNELYPDDLLLLYDKNDDDFIQYLNIAFVSLYGNKTLNNTVGFLWSKHNAFNTRIDFICWLIHNNAIKKCLKVKEVYNIDYDFKANREHTQTETTETAGTSKSNSTLENIEKTFAYDSENAVNDNANTNTDTGNTEHNIKVTKEIKNSYSDKPIKDLIDNEIEVRRKADFVLLTFQIFNDILFLDIYE